MEATIPFGTRTGLKIPPANMGTMRLPDDPEEAADLIRYAIDKGFKYIDTSRGYNDAERKLALALKDGYRERVFLSTKWSPFLHGYYNDDAPTADCVRRRIEQQMERLEVDQLDFYQCWNVMSADQYRQLTAKGGVVEGIRKAIDDGLVRFTGFTSHLLPDDILKFIEEDDWMDVMLVSYNLLDTKRRAALEAAHAKGIGTVVMNPVAGGHLATEESPKFRPIVGKSGSTCLADLAIRYLVNLPFINSPICGISSKSDVDAIVASATKPPLSTGMMAEIENTFGEIAANKVFCTRCTYCMPCPAGVSIPGVMDAVYFAKFLGLTETAKHKYATINTMKWNAGLKADACTGCGACLDKCTQRLDIPAEMEFALKNLAGA